MKQKIPNHRTPLKPITREWLESNCTPARFWGGSFCLEWMGSRDVSGYGRINFRGSNMPVTRVVWMVVRGDIPDGYFICHKCDNPSCINIDHLFLGTDADNMRDMVSKGRHPTALHPEDIRRGERVGTSKLKTEQVLEIRALSRGGWSQRKIAKHFGVSQPAITNILLGRTWRCVSDNAQS